jgi:uncharacterized protein YbjT (DUF2867 family)
MAKKKPIVVVAGATGRAGRLIVDELEKRGLKIRAMIVPPFDPMNPPSLAGRDIEVVEGSFATVDGLDNVMAGADYVISAIGSTKPFSGKEYEKIDVQGNLALAQAAQAAGVKRIVVISTIGAGNSRGAMTGIYKLMMLQVIAAKTRMEEAIKKVGIDYTFVRPGGYTEKPLTSDELAIGEGGQITGMVRREQIATFCVNAIENEATKNRTFEVSARERLKKGREAFLIKL